MLVKVLRCGQEQIMKDSFVDLTWNFILIAWTSWLHNFSRIYLTSLLGPNMAVVVTKDTVDPIDREGDHYCRIRLDAGTVAVIYVRVNSNVIVPKFISKECNS